MWVPKKKAGGSDPAGIHTPTPVIDKIPEWMSRNYGSERYCSPGGAVDNALSRANELVQGLASESARTDTAVLPKKSLQRAEGRRGLPSSMSMENRTMSWHRGKCAPPLGFGISDFADLDDKPRQLFRMTDDWMYQDEVAPRMTDQSESAIHHKTMIDEWWAGYLPKISEKLVPFAE